MSYDHQKGTMNNFIVLSLTFLSNVVSCGPYRGKVQGASAVLTRRGVEFDGRSQMEAQKLLNAFFNRERIQQLTQTIIERFFPLTPLDFEEWSADPEQFFEDTLLTEADEKIRAAAERLFTHLLKQFEKMLGPIVTQMFVHVLKSPQFRESPQVGSREHQTLLIKDAAYLAAGIGYDELFDSLQQMKLEFSQIYKTVLANEVRTVGSGGVAMIRRRVVWLIGEYVDSVTDEIRPHIYESLSQVLADKDMVLRLTAAESLQKLIASSQFRRTYFENSLISICKRLLSLVIDCSELASRRRVMAVLKIIIKSMHDRITPAADVLLEYLPKIWETCEQQNLLRLEIIGCLTGFVDAISYRSQAIHHILLPVLRVCTDSRSQDTAYLVEYGFELWGTVLEHAPILTDDIHQLFSNWIFHMKNSVSYLDASMKILKSYIFLGGPEFVKAHAKEIGSVLFEQLTGVKDEGVLIVTDVIDTFSQMFPAVTPTFFRQIIEFMIAQMLEHHSDGALGRRTPVAFLNVFARLCFENYSGMLALITKFSEQHNRDLLTPLLRLWADFFDRIELAYKKKLTTLALCNFLVTRNANVVKLLLPHLVAQATSIALLDARDDAEACFPFFDPNPNKHEWTEVDRQQHLFSRDPAPHVDIKQYLSTKIKECGQLNGQQNIGQLLQLVDPLVVKQFEEAPNKKPQQ